MNIFQILMISGVVAGTVFASGEHCCASSQFNTKMKIETATVAKGSTTPTITINAFLLDYDRDMKMDKVRGTLFTNVGTSSAETLNYTVINDYGNGLSYNFGDYYGTPYCNVSQINPTDMNNACIPNELTYSGSFTLGSGSDSVKINSFDGMIDKLIWSIQTTVNGCNPIAYSRRGVQSDGTFVRESAYYVDFIQNATISTGTFTPPNNCKKIPGSGN